MTIHDLIKNPDKMKEMEISEILSIIKEGLSGKVDMYDVSMLMKHQVIQRYIQFMLLKKMENKTLDGIGKVNLYDLIFILQTIYNNSGEDTGVSDYDYDRLYELLNNSGEELISSSICNNCSCKFSLIA